jgi:hypothetical protein
VLLWQIQDSNLGSLRDGFTERDRYRADQRWSAGTEAIGTALGPNRSGSGGAMSSITASED